MTGNTQEPRAIIESFFSKSMLARRPKKFEQLTDNLLDWHNKQTNEAIYGFHGFVMEADIIRPEADQAFNYGRLHRAIDDYIAERNKLNNSDGDVR